MKTLMTLFLAVMASHFSFDQTDKQTRGQPPAKAHPLQHANSFAMIEAGVLAHPLSRADDSGDETAWGWRAKRKKYDGVGRAAQQDPDLYKKREHCYLRVVDGSIIYLEGVWEPAKEDAAFTTSTLRLTTGNWRYKEVKVELELVYLLAEREVNINILTKKRDGEVGGALTP